MASFNFIDLLFLLSMNVFSLSRISSNTSSCHFLAKINMKKLPIFNKTYVITPLQKYEFFDFVNLLFSKKNSKIFAQTHGLTPLEKCQFFDFHNLLFLLSTKEFFLSRISSNTFSRYFLAGKKYGQIANFWPNLWCYPFREMPIFPVY